MVDNITCYVCDHKLVSISHSFCVTSFGQFCAFESGWCDRHCSRPGEEREACCSACDIAGRLHMEWRRRAGSGRQLAAAGVCGRPQRPPPSVGGPEPSAAPDRGQQTCFPGLVLRRSYIVLEIHDIANSMHRAGKFPALNLLAAPFN